MTMREAYLFSHCGDHLDLLLEICLDVVKRDRRVSVLALRNTFLTLSIKIADNLHHPNSLERINSIKK